MSRSGQHEDHVDLSDIRWKMLVACDICRKRKVRCDGQRPCLRCSKGGKECTFSTPRRVVVHPENVARASKRPRTSSFSPGAASSSAASSVPTATGKEPPSRSGKEHLLLIDSDDQIVYSGESTGMPLFARLGLLQTVEVSESDVTGTSFASHSAGALGITGATTSSSDYFDLCLQHCPQELMSKLIGYHLNTPVFFPLLHAPSFLSEFVAVTQRRLVCTAQYGALLMSILAVTARLVESARALFPTSERDQAGEAYFELAQDFIRISKNKLDIRHILALYHLALFAEGCTASSASSVSSFVAEAVGLAFTTGLHRSTKEFNMDPVTLQIRTRLFWALYTLDIALAYSQGRPPLIRLSECSVDLPVIVDNEYIKKTEILPQPEGDPPLAMAAAVKMIEIYMVLEQVLSAINAPSRTPAAAFSLSDPPLDRSDLMKRAQKRLDKIERDLPPYMSQIGVTPNPTSNFFYSCRVRTVLQFVRTLIARQGLIDELETGPTSSKEETSFATSEACRLSVDTVKTYSRLRHLGLLRLCGFHAVSHITAAAHTLIACMLRSSNLAFEHRPDLLTAIDILLVFSSPFPHVETVAQLLVQLSRTLDHNHGSNSQSEAVAVRVLARRMARSPSRRVEPPLLTPAFSWPSWKGDSAQRPDVEPLSNRLSTAALPNASSSSYTQSTVPSTVLPPAAHSLDTSNFSTTNETSTWLSSIPTESVEPRWIYNASDDAVWDDSFSFLNDGLFSKL
ncbi:fungal-specific transcription factor domain-containing protein [Exophiala viscosa]|uniref:Fungal-specific transcription factor domain-containing protein n=1 Tax=Exophiala viscosa TaxID=2486360 RepID=A0AAN6IIE7_9EURO|nr:fungal-specific transcription factor domain-containing protein [Exophiala viscosa]